VPRYRVEITQTAEVDLRKIYSYIASENEKAAVAWIREIDRQIGSLEQFPLRCPVIPESLELGKEYRHILYGDYRTIFKVENLQVTIMRVIHGARLLSLRIFEK
jgi:plasmid stabilization system protein ParE